MSTYFHVSIIWRNQQKPVEQVRPIFDLADDWVTYGNGNWIIYTSEDALTWQGRVLAIISAEDSFFLCEIADIKSSGGWLPQWIWDWVKRDRNHFVPPIAGTFPIPPAGLFKK
jgi:hypothetical protein